MAWSAPTYTGGVVWEDAPSENTPLNAADLNTEENAEATYAAQVGQSVANYVDAETARAQAAEALKLAKASNLSDVADADGSRANLKVPVLRHAQCVSTTNRALSGALPTIDGYAVQDGDRVLLAGQTTASQNGPWIAHVAGWVRPNDYPAGAVLTSRSCKVTGGTVYGATDWLLASTANVTVDTTAVTWKQLQPPPSVVNVSSASALQVPVADGAGGYSLSSFAQLPGVVLHGAKGLRRWAAARAVALVSLARVAVMGDSITVGTAAGTPTWTSGATAAQLLLWSQQGYAAQLRTLLTQRFGNAGEGFITFGGDEGRWTYSGTHPAISTGPASTGAQLAAAGSASGTFTFGSARVICFYSTSAGSPNYQPPSRILVGATDATPTALTATQAAYTVSASGWIARTNATLAQTTDGGENVLSITAVANGASAANTPSGTSGFPVTPGGWYWLTGEFKAAAGGALARQCQIDIIWLNAAGTGIGSQLNAPNITDSTSGYVQASQIFQAPGGVQLTAALSTQTAITALQVQVPAANVTAGDTITVTSPDGVTQSFTATGNFLNGQIPITSATPQYNFPIGSIVSDTTAWGIAAFGQIILRCLDSGQVAGEVIFARRVRMIPLSNVQAGTSSTYIVSMTARAASNVSQALEIDSPANAAPGGNATALAGVVLSANTSGSPTGALVHRMGKSGSTTGDWAGTQYSAGTQTNLLLSEIDAVGIDLAVIQLGVNDAAGQGSNSITPTVYAANLTTLCTQIINQGGCVLLVAGPRLKNDTSPFTQAQYYAAALAIAQSTDHVAFVDLMDVWGSEALAEVRGFQNTALWGVHPGTPGHGSEAHVLNALANLTVGENSLTL